MEVAWHKKIVKTEEAASHSHLMEDGLHRPCAQRHIHATHASCLLLLLPVHALFRGVSCLFAYMLPVLMPKRHVCKAKREIPPPGLFFLRAMRHKYREKEGKLVVATGMVEAFPLFLSSFLCAKKVGAHTVITEGRQKRSFAMPELRCLGCHTKRQLVYSMSKGMVSCVQRL